MSQPPYEALSRSIKGKTALITGAASGMGRATAHLLAREGADVLLAVFLQEVALALGPPRDGLEPVGRLGLHVVLLEQIVQFEPGACVIAQPRKDVVHLEEVRLGALGGAVLEHDRVIKAEPIVTDDQLGFVKSLEQFEKGALCLLVLVAPERDHGRFLHGAQGLVGPGEDGLARDLDVRQAAHLQIAHLLLAIVAGHVLDDVLGLNIPDHDKGCNIV